MRPQINSREWFSSQVQRNLFCNIFHAKNRMNLQPAMWLQPPGCEMRSSKAAAAITRDCISEFWKTPDQCPIFSIGQDGWTQFVLQQQAEFLEMHPCRHEHGVADELVLAVSRLSGRRGSTALNGVCWAVAKLIRNIEIETFAFMASSKAEKMLIYICHERCVVGIGHGVFVKNVAGTDMPAVGEVARRAEFVIPT